MLKKIVPLLLITITSISGFSQNTETEKQLKAKTIDTLDGWKRGGVITISYSQSSLTNWAAGGQSSQTASGLLSMFANYKKGKGLWENNIDIGYGSLKQKSVKNWWKSDDKFDLNSKYGRIATGKLYYAAVVNFKTQMAPGYNYPNDSVIISNRLAPAYLLGALGFDYKPNNDLSVFLAPAASKTTIVNDQTLADAGTGGVEAAIYDTTNGKHVLIKHGKKTKNEFGGYIRIAYKKNLLPTVTLQSKIDLFNNYLKDPQYVDIYWENLFSMKLSKYIVATISTTLIYNHNILIGIDANNDKIITANEKKARVQFKEVFALGLSYKF
jgi:hypothetical protein